MDHVARIVIVIALFTGALAKAENLAPLDAYGALPEFDLLVISPNGARIASRVAAQGKDLIVVQDIDTGALITSANVEEVNPRWLNYVDDGHLVLVTSMALRTGFLNDRFEYSAAFSMGIEEHGLRRLLDNARGIHPYQRGLGRIIGRSPTEPVVYMPAFADRDTTAPYYVLYAARLDRETARQVARGTEHTRDWFLGADGKPIIREDFNDRSNLYQIRVLDKQGSTDRVLYETESDLMPFGLVGVSAARDALVILDDSTESGVTSYFLMNIADGAITGPILEREGVGVERVIMDVNRVVYGVEYEGFKPSYAFFDKQLDQRVKQIQEILAGTSSRLVSWSEDFSKLVFRIGGGWHSGAYLLFEEGASQPRILAQARSAIAPKQVAGTRIIEYEARDGLKIPALVTGRDDVLEGGNAPLIVMPHGGPESHDRFGFNYRAQYFASRGYVVLQPQFRGSTGFGSDFVLAGRGQWGKGMQTDLDDGVSYLVEQGTADPDRVCIVGASYGGYAALAAGAFSPDMYRCVVAVAPVTDLRRMLISEKSDYGSGHWVVDYWEEQYGAGTSDKDFLNSISPALHADSFKAPVLLLHGKHDTVVPIEQSKMMHKALKKAKKDVSFVQLKGEDHWLTQPETRLESLRLIAEFIDKHL